MKTVLLIGARGFLGSQVLEATLDKKKYQVSALIREGSNASKVEELGVTIARGDMMDVKSLEAACKGIDVVINTANGYMSGHPEIDTVGAANVADAVKKCGVKRYIYCSVLACDKADGVEHFHHKFLHEQYLKEQGIPFVSLRPGAFIDQADDYLGNNIKAGYSWIFAPWDTTVAIGMVYTYDLAKYFAEAIDLPTDANGSVVDIGLDKPVSYREVADSVAKKLDKPITAYGLPWVVRKTFEHVLFFRPIEREMLRMFTWFGAGFYVNDPTLQGKYFGPPPTLDDTISRFVDRLMKDKEEQENEKAGGSA
mmetsp:Transcript_3024/g.6982  ORF Transcript_3024/g.6982 Transcript_3024/m.6982 type:complete len:310 (-) Transcript_3024:124-1053(-)